MKCFRLTSSELSLAVWTNGLTFGATILDHTEELMAASITTRCLDPVSAKTTPIITLPSLCLTVAMRPSCWFLSNVLLCIIVEQLHSGLVCVEDTAPQVLVVSDATCQTTFYSASFPNRTYISQLLCHEP